MEATIKYLPRHQLEPHPDNPRKELGDLSELAASIKKQGLLQNLTVVPSPDREGIYRIVIGHRRFNASREAGLDYLPCIVDEQMTYAEQIAVMMSENIQRNDLTMAEKAGGVQMMMDLGMDVNEIADNTGISGSTVRRYAKLSALDSKKLSQAERQGATLVQLMEICEIKDADLRAEALKKAGTGEYAHVMYRVRTAEERELRMPLMVAALEEFAERIETPAADWVWADSFRYADKDVLQEIAEKKSRAKAGVKYAYQVREYDIVVYDERQRYDSAKEEARRRAAEKLRERIAAERQIAERFKGMRSEWMARECDVAGHWDAAQAFVLWVLTQRAYIGSVMIGGTFDREFLQGREEAPASYTGSVVVSIDEIGKLSSRQTLRGMVLAAYDRISNTDITLLDRYSGKPKEDRKVAGLYHYMELMGYPVSDEEREWLAGTHECFGRDDEQ